MSLLRCKKFWNSASYFTYFSCKSRVRKRKSGFWVSVWFSSANLCENKDFCPKNLELQDYILTNKVWKSNLLYGGRANNFWIAQYNFFFLDSPIQIFIPRSREACKSKVLCSRAQHVGPTGVWTHDLWIMSFEPTELRTPPSVKRSSWRFTQFGGFNFSIYSTYHIRSISIMTSSFVWNQLVLCPFHQVLVSWE